MLMSFCFLHQNPVILALLVERFSFPIGLLWYTFPRINYLIRVALYLDTPRFFFYLSSPMPVPHSVDYCSLSVSLKVK